MLPTQQNKSLLNNIATTIPPAETEVCRTLENTTCSDQVLPISILPLNFVKRQTKCYFHLRKNCSKIIYGQSGLLKTNTWMTHLIKLIHLTLSIVLSIWSFYLKYISWSFFIQIHLDLYFNVCAGTTIGGCDVTMEERIHGSISKHTFNSLVLTVFQVRIILYRPVFIVHKLHALIWIKKDQLIYFKQQTICQKQ
jgi:hypothetical protein